MMLATRTKRVLAMIVALIMCIGTLNVTAMASLNDTEFHIMTLESIKRKVAEIENANLEDVKVCTINVHGIRQLNGESGTATGGAATKYLVFDDIGYPGINGKDDYKGIEYWKILNDAVILDVDQGITGITVYSRIAGQETETHIEDIYLNVTELDGKLITEIYLYEEDIPEPPEPIMHTVQFDYQNGSAVKSVEVEDGQLVEKPEEPTWAGYSFAGWYTEAECKNAWDFTTPVTENMTLFAKWTEKTDETSTVRFFLDVGSIQNQTYEVEEDNGKFWVKENYIYLNSGTVNVANGEPNTSYAYEDVGSPEVSMNLTEMVNAANIKLENLGITDRLNVNDYSGFEYKETVNWEGDTDNSYHVDIVLVEKSTSGSPVQINFGGTKYLDGSNVNVPEFTFVLKSFEKDIDNPLEEASTQVTEVQNDGYGRIFFPGQSFSSAGTYWFQVAERIAPSDDEYRYDTTVYYIKVTVTETEGNLTAVPTYYKVVAGEKGDELVETTDGLNFYNYSVPTDTDALTITKTGTGSVKVGNTITYTIVVNNPSEHAAEDVVVTDTLDGKLTYVSSDNGSRYNDTDRTVSWSVESLDAGESKTLTVTVTANATGTVNNTAFVNYDGNETPISSNTVATTVNDDDDGGSSGGGTGTTTRYTVTVKYLDEDGTEIAKSQSKQFSKGSDWDVSSLKQESITVDEVTYNYDHGDALTGDNIRSDKVVNLYYTSDNSIEDPDTPLGPGPDEGGETGTEPGTDTGDGTEIIDDGEIPLGNLPQTGTAEAVNPYMTAGLIALSAAMAAAGLTLTRTKHGKREED